MNKYASGALATALAALLTPAWAAVTDAQVSLALPFTAGETVGDPARSVVYLLDRTSAAIVAIDTSTGRQVRRTALTGAPAIAAPNYTGSLAVSPSGSILWVALASAHKLQSYSLPTLTPMYSFTTAYEPGSVACSPNGLVFVGQYHANGNGLIHAVNPSTGADLATLRPGAGYWGDNPQLAANPSAGTRLYAVDGGLSGSQSTIYEYDLTNATYPLLNTYPAPQQNLLQLACDTASARLYTAQGGIAGVTVTALANQAQSTWLFGSPAFANGVALQNGRPAIYALSTDRLYGFTRTSGALLGGLLPPGAVSGTVPRSLCVTGNDKATYLNGNSLVLVGGTRLTLNQAPVLTVTNWSLPKNGSVALAFPFTDAENDPASVRLLVGPAHGVLQGTWPTVTYVPTAGWSGSDVLQVMASDAQGDGSITLVNLNVVNRVPTLAPVSATLPEDIIISRQLIGSDADNDALTYAQVTQPAHGTATVQTGGMWSYQPAKDYSGSDSFVVRVIDSAGASSTATVSLTITPVNDPPLSGDQAFAGSEDAALTGRLAYTDVDSVPQFAYTSLYPTHGFFSLAVDGSFTYIPNPDWNGSDSFGFYLVDQGTLVGPFTATLNIAPVNDAPVASYQVFHGTAGLAYADQLQAFDVEGSPLTFTLVDPPPAGSLELHADGSFSAGWPGAQYAFSVFTYTVSDGTAVTAPIVATVYFDIPGSSDQTFSGSEDNALNGTLTATGAPGATLQFTATSQPAHGTLSLAANGAVGFVPAADWNGSDSFTFTVSDGTRTSIPHTATLAIAAVNDAPTTGNQSFAGTEDTVLNGTLAAGDVDGDPLTFSAVGLPAHGTLSLAASGAFSFSPAANWNGSDSFTFTVSDGSLSSTACTATLDLAAVNDAPTSSSQAFTGSEDTVLYGTLTASDVDSSSLTFSTVTQPAHGTLSLAANGTFSFVPVANWNGTDYFSFKVSDGSLGDFWAYTGTIKLAAANDAPTSSNQTIAGTEDTVLNGTLTASDVDSGTLTFSTVGLPAHGTLSLAAGGTFSFTPTANWNGSDTFTFKVSDGSLTSATYTATLNIAAVNDAPTSSNQAFAGYEDTVQYGTLAASDVDSSGLTFSAVSQPTHGYINLSANGSFSYFPFANWNGSDTFTFKVSDGSLSSATYTGTLNVAAVNDPPTSSNQTFAGTEDILLLGTLAVADVDSTTLTVSAVGQPAHGNLVLANNGAFSFMPAADWNGSDTFTFKVSDGTWSSATYTATLNIAAVNDAPTTGNQSFAGSEDSVLNGILAASDVDSGTLTFSAVGQPAHGTLSLAAGGAFSFTPAANWNGSDTFTFKVSDGSLSSATCTATLSIAAINDAPTSSNQSFSGSEDTVLSRTLVAADADGDSLAFAAASQPAHGALSLAANGAFSFTPAADWNGSDGFTFTVSDGTAVSGPFTATLTLAAVNDAPRSWNQQFTTTEDTTLDALPGGSDPEGDSFSFVVVTQAQHGYLSTNTNGRITYYPNPNWSGTDTATVLTFDGSAIGAQYTFTFVVLPVDDAPTSSDQSFSGTEDIPISGQLTASDIDSDSATLTFAVARQPYNGSVALAPNGAFTYTSLPNLRGSESFTFTVSDGTLTSREYTVSMTIAAVNDAPQSRDISFSGTEDYPISSQLWMIDVDGDTLTSTVVTPPAHGTLNLSASGAFTFTPVANWNGSDSFTFTVSDGAIVVGPYTATLTLAPSNDAPTSSDQTFAGTEDTVLSAQLAATDIDGDNVTFYFANSAAHGIVRLTETGAFTYTPFADWNGSDSFTFMVRDTGALSVEYTATLTIAAVNDAPTSSNQTFTGYEDSVLNGTLVAADVEGSPLTFASGAQPAHGTVAVAANGAFSFTPAANWSGSDSFTFTVSDGDQSRVPYTVNLSVAAANDAPVGSNQTFAGSEDTVLNGTLAASDVEGSPLTFTRYGQPTHGTLTFTSAGTFSFTPAADWSGNDSFTFTVSDGSLSSDLYTATLSIAAVNDAPTAGALASSGNSNQTQTITPVLADVDDGTPSAVVVSGPAHGSVSVVAGKLVYQPAANYSGADAFTYAGNDGTATGAAALVSVQVTGAGLPVPWAAADLGTVGKVGSTTCNWGTNVFTVNGAGAGFTAKSDAGQLLSQSIAGNYQLSAQVLSQTNTSSSAQAGIQLRASSAVGAVDVFLYKTPANAVYVQYRTTTGGSTTSSLIGTYASPWLMLQRNGSTVTAYVTTTTSGGAPVWGTAKKTISITIPTPGLGGLAVSSWTTATLGVATFGTVTVTPTGGG